MANARARDPAAPRPGRRRAAGTVRAAERAPAYRGAAPGTYGFFDVPDRVQRVVSVLGNNRTARLMRVSPSQPSRWRSGKERISGENLRALLDLDHVVSRLLRLMTPAMAEIWLTSHNPILASRPIDLLFLARHERVIDAISSEEVGSYT